MGTTLSSGQTFVLSAASTGLVVPDGATLDVAAGGVAGAATVAAGGSAIVGSGGVMSSGVLESASVLSGPFLPGGTLTVSAGGTVIDTTIQSFASETVLSGGIDYSATVIGGQLDVLAGGSAIDTTGDAGTGVTISSGGTEILTFSGSAEGVKLLSGAIFSAGPFASFSQFWLGSGFVLTVTSGLHAGDTTVSSGAQEIVASGGSDTFSQVHAGGTETVANGGSSSLPFLSGSVTELLGSGGSVVGTTDFAQLVVSSGGYVAGASLVADGEETVLAGGSDSGANITSGSVLIVTAGGSASNTGIGPSGTLELAAGAVLSGPIRFTGGMPGGSGGDSTLVISGTLMPSVMISGFDVNGMSQEDTIDFAGVAFTTGGSASLNEVTGVLSVVENATTYDLQLGQLPNVAGERFVTVADSRGGTAVFAAVPCFAAGTRLATADGGAMAVERLAPGDRLLRADGGIAPVVWRGHRRIDGTRHPDPQAVWPVRIAPHAFGLGRPHRTLRLSPDHAVFADNVLIPVRYLLNGATIVQQPARRIAYFHVELPAHAVLLAEGLPVESYLDTGNRAAFANGGGPVAMHPDFARGVWAGAGCAPLVTAGPVFDRVYRRLIVQALALGWRAEPAGAPGAVRWQAPSAGVRTA